MQNMSEMGEMQWPQLSNIVRILQTIVLHLHFEPAHSLRKNFEQFNFFERRHQTLQRARRILKEQKIVE